MKLIMFFFTSASIKQIILQIQSSGVSGTRKFIPPTGGLLSSSCRVLGPFGPKDDFAGRTEGRTDGRTYNGFKGVRYLN